MTGWPEATYLYQNAVRSLNDEEDRQRRLKITRTLKGSIDSHRDSEVTAALDTIYTNMGKED